MKTAGAVQVGSGRFKSVSNRPRAGVKTHPLKGGGLARFFLNGRTALSNRPPYTEFTNAETSSELLGRFTHAERKLNRLAEMFNQLQEK